MELGDYLSKYRKEANLSIDELAEKSGVPKGTINKIIAGTTKSPTLDTVQALAKTLGKSLDDFLDNPPKSKRQPAPLIGDGLEDEDERLIREMREVWGELRPEQKILLTRLLETVHALIRA